jgi:ribA/ribD-fused uncharacterized protein
MKETAQLYLFWRHQFGQWTLRTMTDPDGVSYNCCEQYMMAKKSVLFDDSATYEKIMQETHPEQQQHLGRTVCGYQQELWDQHKYGIVWYANYLKFTQHEDLHQRLLATGNRILAEASPIDLIWGIGFTDSHPEALQPDKWTGQNLLGKALMSVRSTLQFL